MELIQNTGYHTISLCKVPAECKSSKHGIKSICVCLLLLKSIDHYALSVYVGIQVFKVPLERCSNYTTCDECTGSKDPLCGWCTLEQYCSRDIDCPRHVDEGHWVSGQKQCIVSVSLATNSMDVDLIEKVHVCVYVSLLKKY